MLYLRASTSRAVVIGPFVDETDGVTPLTGLTISASDIRLSKGGAAFVAKNSGGATHAENGYYTLTFNTTDSNTVGHLFLTCKMSGALHVFHDYTVMLAAAFDRMCGGTDSFATDVQTASETAIAAAAPIGANIKQVNDIVVGGSGTELDPWGPAA